MCEVDKMLYRKVQKDIEKWLNDGHDALLITGARQVGKSFLIRETLKKNKINYVEFNFIQNPNLLEIFNSALKNDSDRFLMELEVASNKNLTKDTVIFFDEIQECKEIVTIIKFLVENGKYKYVLSGSLLGVELRDLRSAPVGYMRTIEMFPMDLEEFLIANKLSEKILNYLKDCFDKKLQVSDFIHKRLIDAFYKYLIVGGMPEAVDAFIRTNDLNEVSTIHKKIWQDYKKDFTRYEEKYKLKLISIYDLIPAELNSKNKRYNFSNINKQLKFARYENNFNWLIDAGVSIPVFNVTEYQIPLEASKKSNLFKLFLSDVGMLTTFYGSATILKLLDNGNDVNCGAMFENAIAQELKAHGFKEYYFNNKKHGEVDFLIEYNNQLLPIEVKSGKDYQKHSALSYFMSTNRFDDAFVLSNYNVKVENNITYYPIYMIMFIHSNFKINDKVSLNLDDIQI